MFEMLVLYLEADSIPFTMTSDGLFDGSPIARSFTNFSRAASENGRSRIYLGIRWTDDDIYEVPATGLVAGAVRTVRLRAGRTTD